MPEESGITFADENWKGSRGDSFKEIVLLHVKRITQISSQEFRRGWWKKALPNPSMNYEVEIQYYPDTRESYSNSVEVLHDLLEPRFDKEVQEEAKKINRNLYLLRKKYEEEKIKKDWFRYKRRLYSRTLFRAICKFLQRIGWLEVLEIED